jgi:hypothetical protein
VEQVKKSQLFETVKKLVSFDYHRYTGEEEKEEESYINGVYGWQISISHFPMA